MTKIFKVFIGLLLVSIATSACNLNRNSADAPVDSNPTHTIQAVTTSTPNGLTVIRPPGNTPQVTLSLPTPTQIQAIQANPTTRRVVQVLPSATPIPCRITRTDLPLYTVVNGDTLFSIAQKTNSTVNQLIAINCIANPNLLNIGTSLRVPQLPVPTPTPLPAILPGDYGSLVLSPWLSQEVRNGRANYFLRPATTITVTWIDFPSSPILTQAEIIYIPDDRTASSISLGIDNNLADGVTATWRVPDNALGRIIANAPLPGQNHEFIFAPEIGVRSGELHVPSEIGPRGTLDGSPFLSHSGRDYILEANQPILFRWTGVDPEDYSLLQAPITFYFQPVDNATRLETIGVDSNKADGISVTWTIPEGTTGFVFAKGAFGVRGDVLVSSVLYFEAKSAEQTQ